MDKIITGAWIAAMLLFLSITAKANHFDAIPEEFDKGDYPSAVMIHTDVISVHMMCADGIARLGGEVPTNGTYMGCAFTMDTSDDCVLVLPMPSMIAPTDYVQIRRHEMAHCWGWSH